MSFNVISSPLRVLESQIRSAAFHSSPGKATELAKEMESRKITLDFVDHQGLHFGAYKVGPWIEIGWSSLEALWCATYVYVTLYNARYCAYQKHGPRFSIVSRELTQGLDLYDWSLDRLKGVSTLDWPPGLPQPIAEPTTKFDQYVLDLFLRATAWILHHECGHLFLHRPAPAGLTDLDLEWQADHHATKWLLEGVDGDVATGIRIAICIATGFLEAHRQNRPSSTHPDPFERMKDALQYHPLPADALEYAFALSVLQMNWFLRERRTWVQVEDCSFKELFEQFGSCVSGQVTDTWLSVHPDDAQRVDVILSLPLDPADTRALAYELWEHRGRPWGTPNEDWFAAEKYEREMRLDVILDDLRKRAS